MPSRPLLTIEEATILLNLESPTVPQIMLITALIDGLGAAIDSYCNTDDILEGIPGPYVPPDLKFAAFRLLQRDFARLSNQTVGIAAESYNALSVTYEPDSIPADVQRILQRFTVCAVG